MSKRNYYIDNVKALLIFLVVFAHSIEPFITHKYILKTIYIFIYSFHMPLFVFITGYTTKLSSHSLEHKVSKSLKTYIIVQFIYCIFYIYILKMPNYKINFAQPAWTLWYLLALVAWYQLSNYMKSPLWIPITIIVSLFSGFDNTIYGYLSLSRIIVFLPYFCMGYFFKLEYLQKIKKYNFIFYIITILIGYLSYKYSGALDIRFLHNSYPYKVLSDNLTQGILLRLLGYIIALIISLAVLLITSYRKNIFSMFGRYTLFIYLVHSLVIQSMQAFKFYKYSNRADIIKTVILVFIFTYIFASLFYLISIKFKALKK